MGDSRVTTGETDTVLSGKVLVPCIAPGSGDSLLHSPCGDRLSWVPPREAFVQLGLARRARNTEC